MGKRGPKPGGTKETTAPVASRRLRPSPELNSAEKKVWKRIINAMPADFFSESDRGLLQEYCRAEATLHEIDVYLKKNERYYEDERKIWRRRPQVSDQIQLRADLSKLGRLLKLTPSSRNTHAQAARALKTVVQAQASGQDPRAGLMFGDKINHAKDQDILQ